MNLTELVIPLKLDDKAFKSGVDSAKAGARDLASSVSSITGKALKLGVAAVAAGVTAVATGITLAVKSTMDWASELDSLGDVMDGTNKDFAALAFVARKSGVGVQTFAKANVILEKSLLKSNGQLDTAGEKLKEYGISVKDANGNVKTSVQLTDDIAKKFGELATQQEKVNFLTEIYGKQGAELVDFFDTLAGEGGISAVTKKVEALGLAIDPNRYEQFNRNLEELRLVALGLAVTFTEKVMPVLEGLLKWFTDFIPRAKDAFNKGGWSGLFDLLLAEFNNLDQKLADAIKGIDWAKLGTQFGDSIQKMMTDGVGSVSVPKSFQALDRGITDFIINAIGKNNIKAFKEHFLDALANSINQSRPVWVASLNQAGLDMNQKIRDIAKSFFNSALAWGQQMKAGFENGRDGLLKSIQNLVDSINAILSKIQTVFGVTIKQNVVTTTSGGSTGSHTGGGTTGRRASGGAVIGGQSYNVAEFYKPEVFTPNQSGRIGNMTVNQMQTVKISNWNDFDYSRLATEVIKGMNNA